MLRLTNMGIATIFATVIKQKMCKNKLYMFQKTLATAGSNMQKYTQNSRKTEKMQILFRGISPKIYANSFATDCAICFLLFKAFQRAIKNLNLMTGSGSKYRFRVK